MTGDAHFRLRIPRPLKEWVEESAKRNNRSINAEIISRLAEMKQNEEVQADARRESRYSEILRLASRIDVMYDMIYVEESTNRIMREKKDIGDDVVGINELIYFSNKRLEYYAERSKSLQKKWLDMLGSYDDEGRP